MAIKKQPDSDQGKLGEAANDWIQQFLKHLELALVETGQNLPPNAGHSEYCLLAVRALKLTLLDSGLDDEQIRGLFGRIAFETSNLAQNLQWNAQLNKRRFELIDGDIQGTLNQEEKLELAALTQLMREHVDSEQNLPMDGARKLHAYLSEQDPGAQDSQR